MYIYIYIHTYEYVYIYICIYEREGGHSPAFCLQQHVREGLESGRGDIRGKKSCGGTQDYILLGFLALSWRDACLSYDCISQHCIIDIITLDPSAYCPNDATLFQQSLTLWREHLASPMGVSTGSILGLRLPSACALSTSRRLSVTLRLRCMYDTWKWHFLQDIPCT